MRVSNDNPVYVILSASDKDAQRIPMRSISGKLITSVGPALPPPFASGRENCSALINEVVNYLIVYIKKLACALFIELHAGWQGITNFLISPTEV